MTKDKNKNMAQEETIQIEHADEQIDDVNEKTTDDEIGHEEELALAKDKYLRLFAEFDNFKKRTSKERIQLMQTASQDLIMDLLPVLDDFERAQANQGEDFPEGIQLIYNKMQATLKQRGLKQIETESMPFDAELHEAITEIPAPNDEQKGKIVDVIEKGYYLHDKIIRHAKVVVGK